MGRPRATPLIDQDVEPRDVILDAAARLFTSLGFSAASTRQIAADAGLRQASLFHYFPKKDDILAELLDLTLQPSLDFAEQLAAVDAPPDAALYLLVLRDVQTLCRGPGNLGSLQLQPYAQRPQFAEFWVRRDRLRREYLRLIDAGRHAQVFDVSDSDLATSIVFGMVEGITTWFSHDLPQAPSEIWRGVADHALKGLLSDPRRLPEVRRRASEIGQTLDEQP